MTDLGDLTYEVVVRLQVSSDTSEKQLEQLSKEVETMIPTGSNAVPGLVNGFKSVTSIVPAGVPIEYQTDIYRRVETDLQGTHAVVLITNHSWGYRADVLGPMTAQHAEVFHSHIADKTLVHAEHKILHIATYPWDEVVDYRFDSFKPLDQEEDSQ